MLIEKIEKIGLGPMKEMLKSLGGWPLLEAENWNESNFNWMDSLNSFKEIGWNMNFLFKLTITPDWKNNSKAAIYVSYSILIQYHYIQNQTKTIICCRYGQSPQLLTFLYSHCV